MFGKKDKAEKPAKAASKAPAKAKKSRASSGKSGPNFFASHIEKLMLGLVVAAAGYVVYDGLSRKGYPSDREPTALNTSASEVLRQISEDHWPAIETERQVKHNFKGNADIARKPTNADLYSIDVLDPKPGGVMEKRGDPKVLAPEHLIVQCVSGAIAIEVPKETPDPFDDFENAERIKTRNRTPGGNRRSNNENQPAADQEDEEKTKPPARRLLSKYDLGAPIGAMAAGMGMGMGEGMGMDMGGMGSEGMGMGGMGGMGMGRGGTGGMGGMGGMGESGTGTGGGGLGNDRNRGPKTKIVSQGAIFVAATALVPHKQMADEFERQFKESGDYNLMRDMPAYLSFEIQRVDVTQDPTRVPQEKDWKTISDGGKQLALSKNWAVKPPLGRRVADVIDRNAFHRGLTMPIPPLLVRDYRTFCKHPEINWVWDSKILFAPPKNQKKDKPEEGEDEVLPGQNTGMTAGAGMGGMGGMGMGGMGMGGMGMEGGMDGGMGMDGYGGMDGGMGMEGGMGMGGMGMEGGMDMYGGGSDMMGGGMMGGGMMGGMMGGGMGMSAGPQPEFKMLRFYDMLTKDDVGKAFRYRVRLIMRDPNYPERDAKNERDWIPAPQPSSLLPDVFARVAETRKKDEAAYEADKKSRRTMLKTDWSEPSQPVRIAARFEAFAGLGFDPAANPRPSTVIGEATANIVATIMDFGTGATYSKNFVDARRGSVLNSVKKDEQIEFVVPSNRVIKKRSLSLASNAVVVDMRGGEELGASNKRDGDPLAASGEVMVLLADGTVQITNDIDDSFEYRMYTFADEHETAHRMSSSGGMGGMGGEGGMMGGEGGMGMGGMEGGGGMGGPGGPGGRGGRGGGR